MKEIWYASVLALFLLGLLLWGGLDFDAGAHALGGNPFLRGAVLPRALNIAHRGASSLAPENTLAAARKALELGADAWEIDVQLTKDGELILMHDETLERTTNAPQLFPNRHPWRVRDFTLEEIKRLDAGSWFIEQDPFGEIAAGHISREELESYRGEPVPTLREALEFTKEHDWLVNVELKLPKVEAAEARRLGEEMLGKALTLIRELGLEDRVLISSFDHSLIYKLKRRAPGIAGALLIATALRDPVGYMAQAGADVYSPGRLAFQAEAVRKLRDAGYGVIVWTINDPEEMGRMLEAGVTGIITDYPQRLRELLGR